MKYKILPPPRLTFINTVNIDLKDCESGTYVNRRVKSEELRVKK